ncbi:uncharacterized protein ARB_05756 [Trichophyton benhamiae CBS 112371]|uniref:Uncharacterized protein n=1 Tax=Arthroderma benhamiae (strain ATCC MYA-4681 / CBS 112371) TaxID=663331 RepID=D4ANF1_ARTBC|nr:uncharacterized protein ARB_05756 [Trichophyton benhamiae CBS 112371]EFE35712.1 hypothetical protein ARB_05756 [Trichophyton benhamiae CBS 112371]
MALAWRKCHHGTNVIQSLISGKWMVVKKYESIYIISDMTQASSPLENTRALQRNFSFAAEKQKTPSSG